MNKLITVMQNFICTVPERLELVRKNTPKVSKVWGDCQFIVNYNHTENFEEIYSIYKDNFPHLKFYHNLEPDWGLVTRALLNEVKTPYVLYINEDQELYLTKKDWDNLIQETLIDNDVDYIIMNHLEKYNTETFVKGYFPNPQDQASQIVIKNWGQYPSPGYDVGENVYFYKGKFAPHKRIMSEAVYRTQWFTDLVQEFLEKGDDCTHDIPWRKKMIPNFYEGYYDFHNGMARFPDLKCAIPKTNITQQWDEVKQNRIWYTEEEERKIKGL